MVDAEASPGSRAGPMCLSWVESSDGARRRLRHFRSEGPKQATETGLGGGSGGKFAECRRTKTRMKEVHGPTGLAVSA